MVSDKTGKVVVEENISKTKLFKAPVRMAIQMVTWSGPRIDSARPSRPPTICPPIEATLGTRPKAPTPQPKEAIPLMQRLQQKSTQIREKLDNLACTTNQAQHSAVLSKKKFKVTPIVWSEEVIPLEEKVNLSTMKRNISVVEVDGWRLEANSKWVDESQKKVRFPLHHPKLNS